jgi:hypothetical protein
MTDLKKISKDIRKLLEKRRKELELSFIEDTHTYYMKDIEGKLRSDFPSVSKVYKKFYKQFDAEGKSLQMCHGDEEAALVLREQWKRTGDLSTNLGSRVHYELEKEIVSRNGNYKNVRQPIFEITDEQRVKSDNMIKGGSNYINVMEKRGAVLLDTEIVLGDNELGYVGQPDKVWLMMNKDNDGFGFVITDWKTNQPKSFEVKPYTGKMYSPFETYNDTALTHYYIQLPLYGRLLIKMLQNTKYDNIKLLGCVVVLLREDTYIQEYKVPKEIVTKVLNLDLKKYL